jgi:hypothetical protein
MIAYGKPGAGGSFFDFIFNCPGRVFSGVK